MASLIEPQSTEFLLQKSTGFLFFPHAKIQRMGERNENLIRARIKAGFKSASAAAKYHGWTPSTYASHENGQTPLPPKAAKKYAKAFGCSAGWLLTDEGEMVLGNRSKFLKLWDAIPPEKHELAFEMLEFLRRK